MFNSTEFQKNLRNLAESTHNKIHDAYLCDCPLRLDYTEDTVGESIVCDLQLRISGITYLFVEGRFMENALQITVITEENAKKYLIDNENDAQNMLDVITQHVENYLNTVVTAA